MQWGKLAVQRERQGGIICFCLYRLIWVYIDFWIVTWKSVDNVRLFYKMYALYNNDQFMI